MGKPKKGKLKKENAEKKKPDKDEPGFDEIVGALLKVPPKKKARHRC